MIRPTTTFPPALTPRERAVVEAYFGGTHKARPWQRSAPAKQKSAAILSPPKTS